MVYSAHTSRVYKWWPFILGSLVLSVVESCQYYECIPQKVLSQVGGKTLLYTLR